MPEGKDAFLRLVDQADVVMENFTPGVMAKLGLDYASLREVAPRAVCCSISGFGQSGPVSEHAAYDLIIQAVGGAMSVTSWPMPTKPCQ